jgi:hypothetical protein
MKLSKISHPHVSNEARVFYCWRRAIATRTTLSLRRKNLTGWQAAGMVGGMNVTVNVKEKNPAAVAMGKLGGVKRSAKKTAAARRNAQLRWARERERRAREKGQQPSENLTNFENHLNT